MTDLSKRSYDSSSRKAAAFATRQKIVLAAKSLFLGKGYAGTTMPAIAKASGVALDTVYATVGKKPALFHLLVELAISGTDEVTAAEQRDYVRAIRAEPGARRKLALYGEAMGTVQPRLAPFFAILQTAAPLDEELKALWKGIAERRAANMQLFAADLVATGEVRDDLRAEQVADIIWSMNAPEFYLLLVERRGWTPEDFAAWLVESWGRLLLKP